ncbi:hypothetical protein Asi03nite_66160 [Actinoplanes siamensis]|uniref:Uncharacterized protein n=1 Tax=Actinoplanes siamensis TaxID=1223317 RepID=A0A919NDU3_9ACTN|nr:hypothetical protein Asi03nite_66160 [Actinoplanes siamensis]
MVGRVAEEPVGRLGNRRRVEEIGPAVDLLGVGHAFDAHGATLAMGKSRFSTQSPETDSPGRREEDFVIARFAG